VADYLDDPLDDSMDGQPDRPVSDRDLRNASLEYGTDDSLKAEAKRICDTHDVQGAYEDTFIVQCATLSGDDTWAIRQTIRARFPVKEFSVREWDRRIREARRKLDVAKGNGQPAWYRHLDCSERGPRPSLNNAITALREAPDWQGVLAFDRFAATATTRALTPWGAEPGGIWSDNDSIRLAEWLQNHTIRVDKRTAADAVAVVADEHPFHPVVDYINALAWDGTPRLDTWLSDYLGVPKPANDEVNQYLKSVGSMWMISSVARVFSPGCKVDTCLVLEGKQGKRKSTALSTLFDPWFSDCISILGSKDARMEVHGAWCIEIADLSSYRAAELSTIRSFISSRIDRFRKPYDRSLSHLPRQSVFAATSNDSEWAKDPAGERRMWPVLCEFEINIPALRDDRDQLIAEAAARYRAGEHWWIEDIQVENMAQVEQKKRYYTGPWAAAIQDYLNQHIELETVTGVQLLTDACRVPIDDQTKAKLMSVAEAMEALGWSKEKTQIKGDRRHRYRRPEPKTEDDE
jgi:predicted P-loop ATPase